jgi:hypothetical protein
LKGGNFPLQIVEGGEHNSREFHAEKIPEFTHNFFILAVHHARTGAKGIKAFGEA